MSSDANANKKSDPTDVKGAIPRVRIESECSVSDDENNSEIQKRYVKNNCHEEETK